jgi:hypothetical protein
MPEQFSGLVSITGAAAATTVSLDGNSGQVAVGGGGQQGILNLKISNGTDVIKMNAWDGTLIVGDLAGNEHVRLASAGGSVTLRDNAGNERITIISQAGDILIKNTSGVEVIRLSGMLGDIATGGGGVDGDITVRNAANQTRIKLTSGPPKLELSSASNTSTFTVEGDSANLSLGGGGQGADVFLRDTVGSNRLHLQGDPGTITFRKPNGSPTVSIDGGTATFTAGGVGENGEIVLKGGLEDIRIRLDAAGGAQTTERIYLNGAQGEIIGGGNGIPGSVKVKGPAGEERIGLQGASGTAHFGGAGQNGIVSVLPASGTAAIVLSADTGRVSLRKDGAVRVTIDGATGDMFLGGNGVAGNLFMHPASVSAVVSSAGATILLDAGTSSVSVRSSDAKDRIRLDGAAGDIFAGGNGVDGELKLYRSTAVDSGAKPIVHLDAGGGNMWLGGNGVDGDLVIFPSGAVNTTSTTEASIHLNGQAGDIILKNADCAEEFDVNGASTLDAGTVMVFGGDGALCESTRPYDRKVAGVLSGAGEYQPAIVLDRKGSSASRRPLALVGKVNCKVDADYGAVDVGDLLTTSATPGHAMKSSDPLQSFGAVLGKALRPLKEGKGVIPILVALQ